ncbi:glycoside hydrolase family 2 protein [Adlercreutzia caecimuris]|uniref:glycoside hydrolase family 2 protein n=1 Tax=Adlercreutzia caecimuris TaxID=671266 RepID=UPI0020CBBC24|nr:glycoside hydrolase family 2 TIM barrel-domain containing protein [Adlercreutzia caecimuris]MCR2037262.1 glycoside hydrolase family 2 [Adlercreutzia caecimuris]
MDIKRVLASAPRKHDLGEERSMLTVWGEALDPAAVRQEHPRPQFARERFTMLNGWWDFCIVPVGACPTVRVPDERDGRILVPFSPESLLSGVRRALAPDELLWYVRRVPRPRLRPGERCLLHFEAVDFACACCVNGRVVGTHEGGYLPFAFDITEAITLDEEWAAALDAGVRSEIVVAVAVRDPSDAGTQLRGKQKRERGGIWYTAQSGIWQPVWMEVVPARRIEGLALRPDASAGRLIVDVDVRGDEGLLRLYVTDGNGAPVASASVPVEEGATAARPPAGENGDPLRRVRVSVDVPDPRLWSPEHPHLYDLTLRFGTDVVHSYTAFRTVEVRADAHGTSRFFLNGEPLLLRGVLDQGYWSDGLMTAPSDEAMVFDIQSMKDAGFNMLRKHLKVEADRWYYHCDRLGMLVWQDMVSGGGAYGTWETSFRPTLWRGSWDSYDDREPSHQQKLGAGDERYRDQWRRCCRATVDHLRNHPSVACWVLFNEGWGQFNAELAAEAVRRADPTRPVDAVSGWYDQHCGDFLSVHNYFRTLKVYPDDPSKLRGYAAERGSRAFAISEFGGAAFRVEGHCAFAGSYGYDSFDDVVAWRAAVRAMLDEAAALEDAGLTAFVYTQLSDVEEEVNGILTYDRRVNKLKEAERGSCASDS